VFHGLDQSDGRDLNEVGSVDAGTIKLFSAALAEIPKRGD
jgi:hypothetical protein